MQTDPRAPKEDVMNSARPLTLQTNTSALNRNTEPYCQNYAGKSSQQNQTTKDQLLQNQNSHLTRPIHANLSYKTPNFQRCAIGNQPSPDIVTESVTEQTQFTDLKEETNYNANKPY